MSKLIAALSVLTVVASVSQSQDAKQELAKLKGTWSLEARYSGGQEFKQAKVLQAQVRIDGDQWTMLVKGKAVNTDKIVIDSSKSPKTIDRISTALGGKETVVRGIYKLEGDTLTVAVSPANDAKRPEKFETAKGASTILSMYKRDK